MALLLGNGDQLAGGPPGRVVPVELVEGERHGVELETEAVHEQSGPVVVGDQRCAGIVPAGALE